MCWIRLCHEIPANSEAKAVRVEIAGFHPPLVVLLQLTSCRPPVLSGFFLGERAANPSPMELHSENTRSMPHPGPHRFGSQASLLQDLRSGPQSWGSARSPSALLSPFLGEGSPTKIDRQKGTLILASRLEDLVGERSKTRPAAIGGGKSDCNA